VETTNTKQGTTMKTTSREQVSTGLTVYPVYLADGRVVWVTVPKK
jgi:hypothetical protein